LRADVSENFIDVFAKVSFDRGSVAGSEIRVKHPVAQLLVEDRKTHVGMCEKLSEHVLRACGVS
jgi:hypothetical protein